MKKTLLTLALSTLSLNTFAYEIISEKEVCFPEGSKCYFREIKDDEIQTQLGDVSTTINNLQSKINQFVTITSLHSYKITNDSDEPRIYSFTYSMSVDNLTAMKHIQVKLLGHEFFGRIYKSFLNDIKTTPGIYHINAETNYNWMGQDTGSSSSSGIWAVLE